MVKNLEESLEFYQNIVGLNVERRFNAGPGVEIALSPYKVFLCNGSKWIKNSVC